MPTPPLPIGSDAPTVQLYLLPVSLILAVTLSFLARELSGGYRARWLILATLTWVAYSVNSVLDASIVTTFSVASLFTVVISGVASLVGAAVVAVLFAPTKGRNGFMPSARALVAQYPRRG